MAKCIITGKKIGKRQVVCSSVWNDLGKTRQQAISTAPYSRDEDNRRYLAMLITGDIMVINKINKLSNPYYTTKEGIEFFNTRAPKVEKKEVKVVHKTKKEENDTNN